MPELKPELLPCLRCGSEVLLCETPQGRSVEMRDIGSELWEFVCTNSDCPLIPCIIAESREKAVEEWNTRPPSELERLAREVADTWNLPGVEGYAGQTEVSKVWPNLGDAIARLAAFLADDPQKWKQE